MRHIKKDICTYYEKKVPVSRMNVSDRPSHVQSMGTCVPWRSIQRLTAVTSPTTAPTVCNSIGAVVDKMEHLDKPALSTTDSIKDLNVLKYVQSPGAAGAEVRLVYNSGRGFGSSRYLINVRIAGRRYQPVACFMYARPCYNAHAHCARIRRCIDAKQKRNTTKLQRRLHGRWAVVLYVSSKRAYKDEYESMQRLTVDSGPLQITSSSFTNTDY
ncbi:hypothetical protein EVAR_34193_1 [Eumeta japonica]|uniref:Uncharacterized protein n=1 Tax=Eumeta variegata TaxID=151549 RepID=A0A4C1WKP4_EUMVA|nr:hypothetical protein EVAR_34193_1 [Eumeta japonica]